MTNKNIAPAYTHLLDDVLQIIDTSKRQVYATINQAMVSAYQQLSKRIVEVEQNGKTKAYYGKRPPK